MRFYRDVFRFKSGLDSRLLGNNGRRKERHPRADGDPVCNYKYYLFLFLFLFCHAAFSSSLISKDYLIPYQNNFKLHVREKKYDDNKNKPVVVLLAPLSIPSLEAFDVPNYSAMTILAKAGFDVWGVDFLGEGQSSYPAMPLRARDAVKQLNDVISFISHQTHQEKVSLLGWSWGSVVAAMYSIDYPDRINKLVLYGSMYAFSAPDLIKSYENVRHQFNDKLPVYQNINWSMIVGHWKMMSGEKMFASEEALQAVEKAYKTIDKKSAGEIRRPLGAMEDLFEIWSNHPIYSIDALKTPTLVIYGAQDFFADPALYPKLKNVKIKKEVVLSPATHWLIYEKTRFQFYHKVIQFLRDPK